MRTPSLRPRFAAQYRALRAGTAQMIQVQADAVGIPLDTPEDFFARLLVRCFGRLAELDRHQQASRPSIHPSTP